MRTKNAKRLWPVPVTLGVMALAALLAFGLLATSGVLPAEAQGGADCATVTQGGGVTPTNGNCQVTSTDAIIKLTNDGTSEKTFYVFAENLGTDAPSVYPPGTNFADGKFDQKPLRYQIVEVPARTTVDGSSTVTISGKALGMATVYVYVTDGFPQTTAISNADDESPNVELPSASGSDGATINITYLGPPVRNAPDDHGVQEGSEDTDTRAEPRSNLSFSVGTDEVIDNTSNAITVVATVVDRDNRALTGKITYTVTYVEGSDVEDGQESYTTRAFDYPTSGGATHSHDVDGWNAGTKAVSVIVSAMFTGETGTVDLPLVTVDADDDAVKEVNLFRAGPPATIKAATFSDGCLIADASNTNTRADDTFDIDDDDCGMDARFGVNQEVVVKSHLEDALGSVVSGTLSVALDDEVEDPLDKDAEVSLTTPGPDDTSVWVYTIDKDAMLGDHMITVDCTTCDDEIEDVVLTVAVAGPPDSYSITGPDRVDLNGSAQFTVQAYDEEMGIPHFTVTDSKDDSMVEVFVQGLVPGNTRDLDNGMLDLDDDTGMGSFSVYAPPGTVVGQVIRIFVSSGDSEAQHSVTFGMNLMPMGAAIDDVMMVIGDDPMMVPTSFSDAEGGTLTYEAESSDDAVATASVDADGMVTVTAVAVGSATITVTATDSEGAMGTQTFMVTVEAAHTDTSLQDIPDSSISVTNNANSSITVNWMGGDNADSFIVVAAELGSDPFTYERENVTDGAAKMATISGLNSGSNYMVIVIALQGTSFQYGVLLSVTAN